MHINKIKHKMKNKIADKQLANAKVLADTIKDVFIIVTSVKYCMSCIILYQGERWSYSIPVDTEIHRK